LCPGRRKTGKGWEDREEEEIHVTRGKSERRGSDCLSKFAQSQEARGKHGTKKRGTEEENIQPVYKGPWS